jgi:histidyl-tRNA synthetase
MPFWRLVKIWEHTAPGHKDRGLIGAGGRYNALEASSPATDPYNIRTPSLGTSTSFLAVMCRDTPAGF